MCVHIDTWNCMTCDWKITVVNQSTNLTDQYAFRIFQSQSQMTRFWVLIRRFDFPKIQTMSRIIRVIIQNSSYQNINREEVNNSEIRLIPDSLLLTSSLFIFWVSWNTLYKRTFKNAFLHSFGMTLDWSGRSASAISRK